MFALSLVLLVLGVIAAIDVATHPPAVQAQEYRAAAFAQNFITYRDAVIEYVEANPVHPTGEVPLSSVPVPAVWQPLAAWHNYLQGPTVISWGVLPPQATGAITRYSRGTEAIGVAEMQGGTEVIFNPPTGVIVQVPAGIVPLGAIASVVDIQ